MRFGIVRLYSECPVVRYQSLFKSPQRLEGVTSVQEGAHVGRRYADRAIEIRQSLFVLPQIGEHQPEIVEHVAIVGLQSVRLLEALIGSVVLLQIQQDQTAIV